MSAYRRWSWCCCYSTVEQVAWLPATADSVPSVSPSTFYQYCILQIGLLLMVTGWHAYTILYKYTMCNEKKKQLLRLCFWTLTLLMYDLSNTLVAFLSTQNCCVVHHRTDGYIQAVVFSRPLQCIGPYCHHMSPVICDMSVWWQNNWS